MSPRAVCRAGLGLLASVSTVALLLPRSRPRLDLLDPAEHAAQVTEFGLRSLAALLSAYLALVFLGLLLSAGRLLPASARSRVAAWTSSGLGGGLRRFVGISALTLGVLPFPPLAAQAAETAPVLAPDDATPPARGAPRLEPLATTAPRFEPADLEPVPEPPSPPRPAGPPTEGPPAAGPDAFALFTVQEGDSFWTVAERLTAARLGRPPSDGEVIEPWLALIEANRDRLAHPDDPDLLFPGQVLRLPG